jgi:hypothetical protein
MSMDFLRSESGKPAAPPLFAFSPIERTHRAWRYLWPFQSRQERVLILRIFAVGLLLMSLTVWLFLDHGALPYTLVGGLLGGLWLGPYRSLPAKMTITTRSEARHHLADVQNLVLKIGFVPSGKVTQPGMYHYGVEPPHHALWRLFYVSGQTFDLRVGEHTIELRGQVRWIEWLHRQLAKQLEA